MDEAIRNVCFLSAPCDAAWDEAIENPTLMQYVDKVKVGCVKKSSVITTPTFT